MSIYNIFFTLLVNLFGTDLNDLFSNQVSYLRFHED